MSGENQHLSWPEEYDGILKAWRNLKGNRRDFAHYVYDRCSAYVGPNHQLWAERMIEAAIEAVAQQWQEAATEAEAKLERAEAAVRAAGVEEGRTRSHIADLAEALAVVQEEEASPATAAMNRVKVETAVATCTAIREFLDGFQSRLEAALEVQAKPAEEQGPAT